MTLRSSDLQSDCAWTTFAILAMFSSRRAMPFLLQYCSFQIKAWLLKMRGLKVPRWTERRLNVNRWEIASCPPFCLQKTSLSTSLWMGGKGTFCFSWQIRHHDKWKSDFFAPTIHCLAKISTQVQLWRDVKVLLIVLTSRLVHSWKNAQTAQTRLCYFSGTLC